MQIFQVTVSEGDWTFCPSVAALTVEDAVSSAVREFEERHGPQSSEIFATCDGVRYSVSRRVEYKVTRV